MRKKSVSKTLVLYCNNIKFSSKSGREQSRQIVVYNQYIIIVFLQFRVISKAFENKSSILISLWKESKCTSLKSNGIIECIKTAKDNPAKET
jgi:hypothetical protein